LLLLINKNVHFFKLEDRFDFFPKEFFSKKIFLTDSPILGTTRN